LTLSLDSSSQNLVVRYVSGYVGYEASLKAMQQYTACRDEGTDDQVWLLQHSPVFTQGQAGKPEHLLDTRDIPVVQSDRGGQVTYHGPGQLVAYILFDIDRLGIGPRQLVTLLEDSLIQLLTHYGVTAVARSDAPGVYVDGKKIASIGLRIKKGRSFHGVSLNIDMDLEPFRLINPCGYADMEMTQLTDLTEIESLDTIAAQFVQILVLTFGYRQMNVEYVEAL